MKDRLCCLRPRGQPQQSKHDAHYIYYRMYGIVHVIQVFFTGWFNVIQDNRIYTGYRISIYNITYSIYGVVNVLYDILYIKSYVSTIPHLSGVVKKEGQNTWR